jgi:hypothetical protein
MRPRTALTLMAGVDHERFAQVSPLILRRQGQSARAQAGASRFILAPGCSVPTYSFPPLIAAIRDVASA